MKDYGKAQFWAISSIGYGKGFSPEEALDNYVKTQVRNFAASTTVFKTKAKWEEALRSGEAAPEIWKAPEEADGFVFGMGAPWPKDEQRVREFEGEDRVLCPVCSSAVAHHVAYTSQTGKCVV
jgi:hypothetical protein